MIKFDVQANAESRLTVDSNTFTPVGDGRAIFIRQNNSAEVHATVVGNTISGNDGPNFSRGIEFVHDGPGSGTSFVRIGGSAPFEGNTITGYELNGVYLDARDTGSGDVHATILNNVVTATTDPIAFPISGIQVRSRNSADVISDIRGNQTDARWFVGGIEVSEEGGPSTTFTIDGMTTASAPGAETYLNGANTLATPASASGTFGDGPTPTVPTPATRP